MALSFQHVFDPPLSGVTELRATGRYQKKRQRYNYVVEFVVESMGTNIESKKSFPLPKNIMELHKHE